MPAKRIDDHLGLRAEKPFKATLFQSPRLLVGLNCLAPGQVQAVHDHRDADKFYCVHAGQGRFTVGNEVFPAGAGDVVWAPAGVPHGVENLDTVPLILLVGITGDGR